MAKFNVDLTGDTPDTLDRGRDVEPGWYKCDLDDVHDDSKSGAAVFVYKVLEGKYQGAKIFDRVNDPELTNNENTADMIMRRGKLLCSRLGRPGPRGCGHQKKTR